MLDPALRARTAKPPCSSGPQPAGRWRGRTSRPRCGPMCLQDGERPRRRLRRELRHTRDPPAEGSAAVAIWLRPVNDWGAARSRRRVSWSDATAAWLPSASASTAPAAECAGSRDDRDGFVE